MAVRDASILGSGSGHCSAEGNNTEDLRKTRSWKDPEVSWKLELVLLFGFLGVLVHQ